MTVTPDEELQRAIHALLTGDGPLMGLIGGVYDAVPTSAFKGKSAYVSFGPEYGSPQGLLGVSSSELTVQLDVWSKEEGRLGCKAVADRIERILCDGALTLTENAISSCTLELKRILPDPERGIAHGVLQFVFEIERT